MQQKRLFHCIFLPIHQNLVKQTQVLLGRSQRRIFNNRLVFCHETCALEVLPLQRRRLLNIRELRTVLAATNYKKLCQSLAS